RRGDRLPLRISRQHGDHQPTRSARARDPVAAALPCGRGVSVSPRPLWVSDPGFMPTTRQMALALAAELDVYATAFHTRRGARLPIVGRELGRRTLPPALASRAICAATGWELARAGLARAGAPASATRAMRRRN